MGRELTEIANLAKLQLQYEMEVLSKEEELKEAKERLRGVQERDLPEAMSAAGVSELSLADGRRVVIEVGYHASIPKAKEQEAFAWLRDRGYDGIIKRTITLAFPKGSDEDADALLETVEENYPDLQPVDKAAVHPQTLKAFVKEQIEAGEDIPFDAFGIYESKKAKIGVAK